MEHSGSTARITSKQIRFSKMSYLQVSKHIIKDTNFVSLRYMYLQVLPVDIFTERLTKLPDCVLPYRTVSVDCSCQRLPFTANGHFSVPQELYQAKPGSHEAGGFVNSTVTLV